MGMVRAELLWGMIVASWVAVVGMMGAELLGGMVRAELLMAELGCRAVPSHTGSSVVLKAPPRGLVLLLKSV